jgi:hypothetical protein
VLGAVAKAIGSRELVALHAALGLHAERCPLSGTISYRGSTTSMFTSIPPLRYQSKARKNDAGFATLDRWLGDCDVLILRPPLVVLPWSTWARLLRRGGAP